MSFQILRVALDLMLHLFLELLNVALVLRTALLWCICSPSLSHLVPLYISDRVIQAYYHHLPTHLPEGENPVEQSLIVVAGDNYNVSITQVSREEVTVRQEGIGTGAQDLLIAFLMAQMQENAVQIEQLRLKNELHRNQSERHRSQDRATMERQFLIHNENLQKIAIQSARRV
jgi:hypothetical protein